MRREFDYLTYECRRGGIVVHGWSTYGESSVLAGQPMKCFIDSYKTEAEAIKAHPTAKPSHPLTQAVNTFDHLSDEPDFLI